MGRLGGLTRIWKPVEKGSSIWQDLERVDASFQMPKIVGIAVYFGW
jgi:hypothetical protein